MKTGFYDIGDELGLTGEEALSYPPVLDTVFGYGTAFLIEPWRFLHGVCDMFALWLATRHGYDIEEHVVEFPRNRKHVIHIVGVKEIDGVEHWADIRGLTDDKEEMLSAFTEDIDREMSDEGATYVVRRYLCDDSDIEEYLRTCPREDGNIDGVLSEIDQMIDGDAMRFYRF